MTARQHTPGPWAWFGNARNREVYLATTHSGRRYVMGFQRWGMKGAQPMFQPADRGLVAAEMLLKFEVGDQTVTGFEAAKADDSVYRFDIRGIDCADARLIATAPELLDVAMDILPRNLCLTNPNVRDDVVVPLDVTMGELRKIAAVVAKATGQ